MKNNNKFWGVAFILSALFLVLNQFGFLGGINGWTLIFTVFLFAVLFKSIKPLKISGIIFPLAFLYILYDTPLNIEALSPWMVLLVAVLLNIGLSLLFSDKKNKKYYSWTYQDAECTIDDQSSESYISQSTSFGSSSKYVNSKHLKQGYLACNFGEMKVYFDNVKTESDTINLQVDASFSGVELFLPKNWSVEERTTSTFGGVEYKNQRGMNTDTTVILTGNVSFAAISITFI